VSIKVNRFFLNKSSLVCLKLHETAKMSWKFTISRATAFACAAALCLGLMQFAMAQEVAVPEPEPRDMTEYHSIHIEFCMS